MSWMCDRRCNFCYPNKWRNKSEFNCKGCKTISEFPAGLNEITRLYCRYCRKLTFIPLLPSLTSLDCPGCHLLTRIPELNNIQSIGLNNCILLTEWKRRGENMIGMSCRNCPLLHLHPSLFIRFHGLDHFYFGEARGNPRPRNGISSRFLSSFSVCKKLYCFELPSHVALEVSLNAILYAPGGAKYLELADRYKDGIQVFKKRNM